MRIFYSSLLILALPAARATPSGSSADVRVQVNNGVSEGEVFALPQCKVSIAAFGPPDTIKTDYRAREYQAVQIENGAYVRRSIPGPVLHSREHKSKHIPKPTLYPILISMSQTHTSHRLFA
jgi:hypothetical protein